MKFTVAFLFSLLFISCSSTKFAKSNMPAFDKEGHRGCRGLMPENTIAAMLKAIELGVTTIEMDIAFTKDNEAIVSHDPFFSHEITTKPNGKYVDEKEEKSLNIYKMTFAQTQQYDVGLKPHPLFPDQQKTAAHKPRLADLIDSVENYIVVNKSRKVLYNIETKTLPATDNIYHPAPQAYVDMLMKVINEKGIAERVIIQSFDFRTLQYMHQQYPTVKTSVLIKADNKSSFRKQMKDLGFTPTIYSPDMALVTEELIKNCHNKKMRIIPFTVNDKAKIEELKKMGVDGIMSDYPNLL